MKEIEKFITGFKRFQENYFNADSALFEELKKRQQPKAVLIGCCDSRVDPAILTGCDPGDIFVIRNVANLVPPFQEDGGLHGVSAALEFAVCHLGVEHIIILGHSQCGGIRALVERKCPNTGFIGKWVTIAEKAREKVVAELSHKSIDMQSKACEQAAILLSMENLLTFPWIRERAESGKIHFHGWYFDIATGNLLTYNPAMASFEVLT